ncbi:Serine/threonine-protein kinase pkn5 [Madurella mycetomatis]|uniref:Serine/threonine-protein kinase pkn5 n=1 Tax=Madurella mycetomatis TaxID=100816 RepID=A0A175VW18_9PEZI|nr:Serine/threonine-protein kinase pkn5 [Madurella mycetomatis]
MRYELLVSLGSEGYGAVYRAMDRRARCLVAVKLTRGPDWHGNGRSWEKAGRNALMGEERILRKLSHAHIIECFHTEGWGSPTIRKVMELTEGDVGSLVGSEEDGYDVLLPRGFSTRYSKRWTTWIVLACRSYKTRIFTAPELFASPRVHKQSHKSDVWALYVTILWMLDRHKLQGLSEEMARADLAERATAAQMLAKLFGG